MKQFILYMLLATSVFCFFSCDLFVTPIFSSERDFGDSLDEYSTSEIIDNIKKFPSDPKSASDLLTELSERCDEASEKGENLCDSLSLEEKEAVLTGVVSSTIPVSTVADYIDETTSNTESEFSYEEFADVLIDSGAFLENTSIIEALLSDAEVLDNADAYSIMLSATSLVASAMKKQKDTSDKSVTDLLSSIKVATQADVSGSGSFTDALVAEGFSPEIAAAINISYQVTSYLTENRGDETDEVSLLGFNMGDFLDDFFGIEKEETGSTPEGS